MKQKIFDFIVENEITIPTYQRIYTWGKKQIEDFINDLADDLGKDRNVNLGVVYYEKKSDKNYEIIDGQQRITTYFLLTNVLLNLYGDPHSDSAKILKKFNKEKKLKTLIGTLNGAYDDYYDFINSEELKKDPTDILKLLNKFTVLNETEDEEKNVVKSELISSMIKMIEVLNAEDFAGKKEVIKGKLKDKTYIEADIFAIENPYSGDPISLFERLNNRGVELNFVSLSKIKVHQHILHSNNNLSTEAVESLAINCSNIFHNILYHPLAGLPKTTKMSTKDSHIQSSLINFLEVHFSSPIGSDKNIALDKLGEYLSEKLTTTDALNDYSNDDLKKYFENIFSHFQIYLSLRVLFESRYKSSTNKAELINSKITTVNNFEFLKFGNVNMFDSVESYLKLKVIKIEKYNKVILFILSKLIKEYIDGGIYSDDSLFDEFKTIASNLVILSISYWIEFIGPSKDYTKLLRDDLQIESLYSIIKHSKTITTLIKGMANKTEMFIEGYNSKPQFNELVNDLKKVNLDSIPDIKSNTKIKVDFIRDFIK